jgi:hypothetical protein
VKSFTATNFHMRTLWQPIIPLTTVAAPNPCASVGHTVDANSRTGFCKENSMLCLAWRVPSSGCPLHTNELPFQWPLYAGITQLIFKRMLKASKITHIFTPLCQAFVKMHCVPFIQYCMQHDIQYCIQYDIQYCMQHHIQYCMQHDIQYCMQHHIQYCVQHDI